MKIKYRLEDPNNCIPSYLLNNFNGWSSGDRFPNVDYIDVITEEMLNTPHGLGFYTRVADSSGEGVFYIYPDYTESELTKAVRKHISREVIEPLSKSSHNIIVKGLDKIKKTVPNYSINSFDKIIKISDQDSFDQIQDLINDAIKEGAKSICVQLKAHTLFFSEKHLLLTEQYYPEARGVKIKIDGLGVCSLLAAGRDYSTKTLERNGRFVLKRDRAIDVNTVFLSEKNEEIINRGKMKSSSGLVEAVSYKDKERKYVKEARIRIDKSDLNENPTHVIISTQYQTSKFPVVLENGKAKVKEGFLFFEATPINYAIHNQYYTTSLSLDFLNRDYSHGRSYPRYQLVNGKSSELFLNQGFMSFNKEYTAVHECEAQTFIQIGKLYGQPEDKYMSVSYCPFKTIEITGITFIGNADYGCNAYCPEIDQNALIRIDAFKNTGVYIHDNTFKSIRSKICSAGGYFIENGKKRPPINKDSIVAKKILFENNEAYDCYRSLISGSANTKSIYCICNTAKVMNRSMYYEGVINIVGKDFLIRGNHIEDFSYSAVRSGMELDDAYKNNPKLISKYASEGIIENNEFGWSAKYRENRMEYALMDCGAIYTYCRNARLIIRDNVVYNYQGLSDASSGIYIDGYAENVKVYRNLVVNCGTTSIRMYRNETDNTAKYKRANNNLCIYNFVTSPYYFTAYDNSVKGQNYLATSTENVKSCTVVSPKKEDDYQLYEVNVNENHVTLPAVYSRIVESLNLSNQIKQHIHVAEE